MYLPPGSLSAYEEPARPITAKGPCELPLHGPFAGYRDDQAETAARSAVLTSILRGCARSVSGTLTFSTPST